VAVLDLDVHQGNGTASILSSEPRAFTFSIHRADLYPEPKGRSSLDIGLPGGAGDPAYLKALREALPRVLDGHRPSLVLVQAGVDPWEGDLKGGLALTREGLAARDRMVFRACFSRGIPAAVTLGGGYAPLAETSGELHAATLREAAAAFAGRNGTHG